MILIGNLDGTSNGQNGNNLQINFSNYFINGNFEFDNAVGNSKKEAQQKAATLLLKKVDNK